MENKESQTSIVKINNSEHLASTARENSEIVQNNLQNGRHTRYYFTIVLHYDYCLMIFAIACIILSVLYYDADYTNQSKIANFCLYIILILLPVQIIVTTLRYYYQLQLEKCQKIQDSEETVISSKKIYSLVGEVLVLILRPYIFLNDLYIETQNIYDGFTFPYKLNYILVFLNFIKIYIIIRVVLLHNSSMSPRSSRLCRMYGCSANYLYGIKCLFKDSPIQLIGFVLTFSVFFFAISLRIAERNLTKQYPKHFGKQFKEDLQKFQNALWLTIITMTTVGYGDFYPRTFFGRLIDVLLVVWGTFIVSIMVVVLTNTLNMDQSQKTALVVLNRLEAKKSLKEAAAFLITHTCRKYLIHKKVVMKLRPPLSQDDNAKLQAAFYKYLINFQNVRRTIRSMYEIDDTYAEMIRQFEFINDEVGFLLSSQEETLNSLKNYLEVGRQGEEGSEVSDQLLTQR